MFDNYEDNWLVKKETDKDLIFTFNENIDKLIKENYTNWTLEQLKTNFDRALLRIKDNIDNNPYIALSGGVDSQLACLSFLEAQIPFTAVTMVMNDDFNKPDVESAVKFCKRLNIPHKLISINIIKFLVSNLNEYSLKYKCPSPQFCSHFYFFEQILQMNPSCLVLGGFFPHKSQTGWFYNLSQAQISWQNFKNIQRCNMIGDFSSYSFDISLYLMMTLPAEIPSYSLNYDELLKDGYEYKIAHLKKIYNDITPQYAKLTGFERLKSHFNKLHNNVGAFNKLFRRPLEKNYTNHIGVLKINEQSNFYLNHAYASINNLLYI